MTVNHRTQRGEPRTQQPQRVLVSPKTLAEMLDVHASTVRRWLDEAGIRPVIPGGGPRRSIRYRWDEVKVWLEALEQTE
jgi:excisionase family DNA binding protein